MTEDKAKTKWCPMLSRGHIANRSSVGGVREDLSCIGSECMAWRWTNSPERIKEHKLLNKKGVGQPGRENKPWPEEQPAGYCGLAGKL